MSAVQLIAPSAIVADGLPALIASTGDRVARRFLEFFTVHIRNRNTRAAYARAAHRFLEFFTVNIYNPNMREANARTAGVADDRKRPLFCATIRKTKKLGPEGMAGTDVWYMVRRRAADAGIEAAIGCRTFRATGITDYLTNGGRTEVAPAHGRTLERENDRPLRPA
jgi:hypothetical protein